MPDQFIQSAKVSGAAAEGQCAQDSQCRSPAPKETSVPASGTGAAEATGASVLPVVASPFNEGAARAV